MKKNQSNGFNREESNGNEKHAPNNQPPFEAHSKPMTSPNQLFINLSIYAPPRKVIIVPNTLIRRYSRMARVPITQTLISIMSQQLMN